jgi:putative ABC transport system permease protein
VTALLRKLIRDLIRLRGQVITIALVVAAGISAFVAMRGAFESLQAARTKFYDQQRFADVFGQLERAPESVRADLEALPGVARVETRVVKPAMLPLPQLSEPVRGQVLSLSGDPTLNLLRLRDGRMPEPDHSDEAVVLESFAEAHRFLPGDRLPVVINGKKRDVVIVGVASSPEYVVPMVPGSLAVDPGRFAVLWMGRDALAAAFQMEGAFNDVSLELRPNASVGGIIDAVDRILGRYGGLGAYARDRQPSNMMIDARLQVLSSMAGFLPTIFLAVAALLVNLVLSRLILLQQPEIATLKALGYSNLQVGLHFLELVLVVALAGSLGGIGLGRMMGGAMMRLYAQYYRFPDLGYLLDARDVALSLAIAFFAAAAGAFGSVRRVTRLPPAEAMRPPAPAHYRRSIIDRLRLRSFIGPAAHMVVRELERRPLRTLLSAFAIAAATALSVIGGWYYDGVEALFYGQFQMLMREDAAVTFIHPRPERAIRELAHLPGVLGAEGLRQVPVRFHSRQHHRDGVITGYPDDVEMRRPRDAFGRAVTLPPDSVILTDVLARILDVKVGDTIDVELHEGARGKKALRVSGVVNESFGLGGHMRGDALRAWLGEEPMVTTALLRIDQQFSATLDARLKDEPAVVDVTKREKLIEKFREQVGNMIVTMAFIIALFAATITIGVVYNNARVALSMRGRDLASLRVLGFTRGEISAILIGEQMIQVLAALPIGLLMGRGLVFLLSKAVDAETYRLPLVLTNKSYAFGMLVTLIAAVVSALLVRRRLDKLDLVAVLKTRE